MNVDKLVEQLLQIGTFLTSKAFELAVRQIHLQAIVNAVLALIFLVTSVFLWKKGLRFYKEYWYQKYTSDNENFAAFLYALGMAVSAFLTTSSALWAFSYLYNPEWYAVKLLLDTLLPQ